MIFVYNKYYFPPYSTLKESVGCVDDHMNYCFTATQRKVFNHVVAGARQFLIELCVPGQMQEGKHLLNLLLIKMYRFLFYKALTLINDLTAFSRNIIPKSNIILIIFLSYIIS